MTSPSQEQIKKLVDAIFEACPIKLKPGESRYLPEREYMEEVASFFLSLTEPLLEAAQMAEDFGIKWAKEHQEDDYMVTIDHKDEMLLADLVFELCTALADFQRKIGGKA